MTPEGPGGTGSSPVLPQIRLQYVFLSCFDTLCCVKPFGIIFIYYSLPPPPPNCSDLTALLPFVLWGWLAACLQGSTAAFWDGKRSPPQPPRTPPVLSNPPSSAWRSTEPKAPPPCRSLRRKQHRVGPPIPPPPGGEEGAPLPPSPPPRFCCDLLVSMESPLSGSL